MRRKETMDGARGDESRKKSDIDLRTSPRDLGGKG